MSTVGALVRRRPALDSPPLPHVRERVLARLRATALDRQLADGVVPWRSRVHAARGVQLTSARARTALAGSLEHLLAQADFPRTPPRATIPPCAEQVHAARSQILQIASKLRSGSPADCRGIAKLRVLLSDGAGPFYLAIQPTALALALDDVSRWLDAMD